MTVCRYVAFGYALILSTVTLAVPAVYAQEHFRLIPDVQFLFGMEQGTLLVSGETLIPAGGQPGSGTRVNVSSSLGVEYGESTGIVLQATMWEDHVVDFGYLMALPTGMKKVPHSFRFQNKTYPAGTLLETRIDFNWLRLSYGYKLFQLSSQWLGPRIGVHYVTAATTINGESEEAGIISNTRRLDGTFPVIGLEARYLLPLGLDLNMELEGVYLFSAGYLAMLKMGATWEVYPNVSMTAGLCTRIVQHIEDNQPLNNEWTYNLASLSIGLLFGF
ncbi:MAG: hypothetical protein FJY85_08575 [Deltaproteobacteria bacterium]|nr:hypothetical protein [Deltaproteobacteria bacterium]